MVAVMKMYMEESTMKKRTLLTGLLATTMALSLAACSSDSGTESTTGTGTGTGTDSASTTTTGDEVAITICGTNGLGDTQSLANQDFADRLNALGGWKAVAMVSSEMGSTDDVLEQAQQGVAVTIASDPARLASYVPEMGILMMPYLFDDYSQLDSLLETELYAQWKEELKEDNLYLLTNNCLTGWRNWVSNSVVETPEDLNGLKIRTMGNSIALNSVNAMGAVATPLNQNEAYNAISTGVIDGGEWQIPTIYSSKFYEVCNNVSLSKHFLLTGSIVTGTGFYDSLSSEMQAQIDETAIQTYKDNQELVITTEAEYIEKMEAEGVVFTDPDRAAFAAATEHLYSDPSTTGGADYETLREELLKQLGV